MEHDAHDVIAASNELSVMCFYPTGFTLCTGDPGSLQWVQSVCSFKEGCSLLFLCVQLLNVYRYVYL